MVFRRLWEWFRATFLGTDRRVLVLALARMADSIANSFLIVVLPLYLASGQIPIEGLVGIEVGPITVSEELLIGIVLSLFGFLNSLGQPFTGRLSDRTGRRRPFILGGLALLGVASAAYAFVDNYYAVVAFRMLQGLGAALTIPATVALVNELATSVDRGENFGVFNTFRLLGFGLGPIVAGVLITGGLSGTSVVTYRLFGTTVSGFEAAFAVAVLGAAVSFALVTLLVSDPPETEAAAGEDLSVAIRDPTGEHLFDPVFTLGLATLFMAIGIGLFATLQELINSRLDQGPFLFSVEFAAVVIANVVLQVPIGQASDRYGRRPFIVAGFVLLVPTTFVQGIVTEPLLMIAVRLGQGVAVAMVFAPALALAGDLAGEGQSGTQLSILTMAFGLGVAIGPLASGFLVGFGFVYPFAFGAVLAAIGLVFVYTQVEETVSDTAAPGGDIVPQDD
ncbi:MULTISPECIES: MFS transporter [Halococcus]|uniref:Multidrug resistance protein-like protein n=1 Tax=Halococcus salifodinae DSM 8989 TaxID=1227456 RepID=M0MXB4_9EURY|nr:MULTISPECIES: MFS transporter [Halococcus]EMA49050.1 multidrug resistance protein-like protein [Halococcus salifodinae DSM 8989]